MQSPSLRRHNIRRDVIVGKDNLLSRRRLSVGFYRHEEGKRASEGDVDDLSSIPDMVFMRQTQDMREEPANTRRNPRPKGPAVQELASVGGFTKSDGVSGKDRLNQFKLKL